MREGKMIRSAVRSGGATASKLSAINRHLAFFTYKIYRFMSEKYVF